MDDITVKFTWEPEDAGNRTIVIEIDPAAGAVDELDESNNNAPDT